MGGFGMGAESFRKGVGAGIETGGEGEWQQRVGEGVSRCLSPLQFSLEFGVSSGDKVETEFEWRLGFGDGGGLMLKVRCCVEVAEDGGVVRGGRGGEVSASKVDAVTGADDSTLAMGDRERIEETWEGVEGQEG
jgi:hypothetical protein